MHAVELIGHLIFATLGPGVTGNAIISHAQLGKQKFRKENLDAPPPASGIKKRLDSETFVQPEPAKKQKLTSQKVTDLNHGDLQDVAMNAPTPTENQEVVVKNEMDSDSEDNQGVANTPLTSAKIPGAECTPIILSQTSNLAVLDCGAQSELSITWKRSSPRNVAKHDYHKLNDPFGSMEGAIDENGGNVFGAVGGYSSEDSDEEENFGGDVKV